MRSTLLGTLGKKLASVEALATEACFEPALWRPAYHAEATRRVVLSLAQMLQWLRMFSTCLAEKEGCLAESADSGLLSQMFGLEKLRRWLTREWVSSLQCTNREITSTLSGLSRAVTECLKAGERSQSFCCNFRAADRTHRAETLYLCAMHIQGLETRLKRELGQFLSRYDWILSGRITESQLKILAGAKTEQYLTNLDVLFYNSLVFATRGFVRELLGCSLAVRELATAEAGTANLASPADISVLAKKPSDIEEGLIAWGKQTSTDSLQFSEDFHSGRSSPTSPAAANAEEAASSQQLALTVVGPDRIGIVHDVARAVFNQGGSVAASRMTKLDLYFAVVMQIMVPSASIALLESELEAALPGLQISLRVARDGQLAGAQQQPPYRAELHCICPEDAPGLLMRFTSVLVETGLNILQLDTKVRRLASGRGFVMVALVGSELPVDGASLQSRLDALCENEKLGIAARINVALAPPAPAEQGLKPQAEEDPIVIEI